MEEAVLDIAPASLRAVATDEWSEAEQEPDLDIILRSHRTIDAKGLPCSRWEYGYAVEGEWKGPLSQPQRDYAGALMRHMSNLIQDPPDPAESLEANLARIASRVRAELKTTANLYANLTEHMVREYGLHATASMLGLKERQIRHLLKSRGRRDLMFEGRA